MPQLTRKLLFMAAATALLTAPLTAQDRSFGFGVGLQSANLMADDIGVLALFAPQAYLTIGLSDALLLEPSFGTLSARSESGEYSDSQTYYRLGIGLLLLRELDGDGRWYFGPRLGLLRISSETDGAFFEDSMKRTDLALAGVVGGELFLGESFSLGGEMGIEWIRRGDPEITPEPPVDDDETGGLLRTVTELKFRWYVK